MKWSLPAWSNVCSPIQSSVYSGVSCSKPSCCSWSREKPCIDLQCGHAAIAGEPAEPLGLAGVYHGVPGELHQHQAVQLAKRRSVARVLNWALSSHVDMDIGTARNVPVVWFILPAISVLRSCLVVDVSKKKRLLFELLFSEGIVPVLGLHNSRHLPPASLLITWTSSRWIQPM